MLLTNLKALIVILAIAAIVFRLAKPLALLFSSEADFARRRNVWFALTVAAFVSPSFWLFVLVAVPLLISAGRKDANPAAFYVLLLHVIPPIAVEIPAVAVNRLFALDMYRLLSFCVLLPAAWNLRRSKQAGESRNFTSMDLLLIAWGVMQTFLFIRPDTPDAMELHDSLTNVLRRAVLFGIDIYLPYYVVSRSCTSRRAVTEVLAAFCLACAVMAPIALFESVRHWLVYAEINTVWRGDLMGQYSDRGGGLRATVSSGHSLALGYLMALAMGFWLYLRTHVSSKRSRLGVMALFWAGLLAAYSRGPWVGAVLIYFVFTALGPRSMPRLVKSLFVSLLIAGAVLISPLGDRVAKVIPFLGGTVDSYNIDYRERLAERSWEIIADNPFVGDQDAYSKLHDMRQGFGIVDFVNSYAGVAVFYGLIGLFFFVGFILVALVKSYRTSKLQRSDPDLALLGTTLVACILGTLLMMGTASFMFGYEKLFYVLGGLAAAYAKLGAQGVRSRVLRGAERVTIAGSARSKN